MTFRAQWSLLAAALAMACRNGAPAPAPAATASTPPVPSRDPAPELEADQAHAELLAKNPPGLSFRIALPDGGRFRQGERIVVELSFRSTLADKYRLDGATYDRGGRLMIDEYRVSPKTTVDPLADYFASGWGQMGGLRTTPVLGEKPYTLRFELNEWHRFDKPGRYRLYVVSERVSWEREGDAGPEIENHNVVSQNALELVVVAADRAWQERTLAEVRPVLDDPKSTEEQQREALRTLRFLNSEAAVVELAERLQRDAFSYETSFGLYGTPHRALAIRELDARITRPDYAVSRTVIHTLAALKTWHTGPAKPDPAGAVHERRGRVTDELADRVARALPKKTLPARAVSVDALLALGSGRKPTPSWLTAALAQLPSVLAELPATELDSLLRYRFRPIAALPIGPALATLVAKPELEPGLRQIALLRLLEVSPADGRRRILDVIQTGQPDLGLQALDTLRALPDARLPAVEATLADRLERCGPHCHPDQQVLIASLIQRYATAAIAPRVKAAFEKLLVDDDRSDGAFIAYFLTVDPKYGQTALKRLVEKRSQRTPTDMLSRVAELGHARAVEPFLIAELGDSRPAVAAGAARALGRHGSRAAEAALWKRLGDWSRKWRGKQQELRRPLIGDNARTAELELERALWQALATGRGWLTDRAGFEKLRSMLVTDAEKQQLGYKLDEWKRGVFPIRWHRSDGGELRIGLAQYDLESIGEFEAKLAQFPRGTRFEWSAHAEAPTDFAIAHRAAQKHGHRLTRQ